MAHLLFLFLFTPLVAAQGGAEPRVLVISVDGLRPDVLSADRTPHIDALRLRGAFSAQALALYPTLTVPNHVSMLTGVEPHTHQIIRASTDGGNILTETVLSLARASGFTAGLFLSSDELSLLAVPGSFDRYVNAAPGELVSDRAVEAFESDMATPGSRWHVAFVHLVEPDAAGHQNGWLSPEYLDAVARADVYVGRLVVAVAAAGLEDDTVVIVTSDHGGRGNNHRLNGAEDSLIPWVSAGPGIAAGTQLTGPIVTADVAPTILRILGLPVPEAMQGAPVREMFGEPLPRILRGDVNGSGTVNLSDAISMCNALFMGHRVRCFRAIDADGNDSTSLSDPIRLLAHFFLGGSPLPPPFPHCGPEASRFAATCQTACP